MSDLFLFRPPRQRGLLFHGILILVVGGASVLTFLFGVNQQAGTYFILCLIISLILFAPLPWIIYRAYALSRAVYRLERDGLSLRWGLRSEDIPLPDVEWVRQAVDLASAMPLPRLHWPGALLGSINVPDLGPVEYLAADISKLLLVATYQRVYAISPEDPEAFLRAFQRATEMGSLTPISSVSVLPAAYLSQIWEDMPTRVLLISGFLLNLLLFVGTSLLISGRAVTSMGFYPNGTPLPGVPAAQLLLLPILGAFIFVIDLATGLFFFRRAGQRPIAYIVMGSSVTTGLLLLIAILPLLATLR